MRHTWVIFYDGVPEYSSYREESLPFLAESMLRWEGSPQEVFELVVRLKEIPTGFMVVLHGHKIVKIWEAESEPSV